jgi:hypothetical protein
MSTRELTADVPTDVPTGVPTRRAAARLRPMVLLAADAVVLAALWFAATHVVTPVAGLLHVPQWPVAILAGIGAGVGGLLLVVRLHRRS